MKSKRHALILELIREFEVETQEEMQALLLQKGVNTTQATVSRDINALHLVKSPIGNGRFKYILPPVDIERQQRFQAIFQSSVTAVDFACNTVVLRCESGMAGAACAAFDSMDFPEVVGTIAGDDTFFVLMRSENDALVLCKKLQKYLLE